MEWWFIAILVVAGVVALLAAYGAWLIGQGSDAEFQARSKAADSAIFSSGWFALDWARTATLPFLGSGQRRQTLQCPSCRHTWSATKRAGWPACPNCGEERTKPA